jgi:NADH dehydrogenase
VQLIIGIRRGIMENQKRIVILGAGYGGVHAAKLLFKKFKKNSNIRITLIDKNPFHTLMTELHEVAGARVEPNSVQISLRKIFGTTNIEVVRDTITRIDFEKQILISDEDSYEYDYLIIGTGSQPAFFGVPGVRENAFCLWSFEDALKIREHIEKMFQRASLEKSIDKRREMLTFVVAGAGFTGVEMIGELAEWKKKLCRDYNIDEREVRLIIVEALGKILPILNDKLILKAEKYLKKIGVEILTNSPIVKVDKNTVQMKNGSEIKTQTLIWTCGVQGNQCSENLGLTMGKKCRIQTNEYMQSVDYENVYVIGDNAYFEEDTNRPIPQIVEAALQTAETAVHNIISSIEGKSKKAFKSSYHGLMVSIGSRYAVAELIGISLTGFFAMAMKHLVNIHYLFGVAGFNQVWAYILHEFFHIKDNRSIVGGHLSAKTPTYFLAILRVYVGVIWLLEGVKKINDGWLKPGNIHIVATNAVSGASQAASDAVSSASQAAGAAAANMPTPILAHPPAFYQWFMDTFIAPYAYIFQVIVVLSEVAIGLALIAGIFTFLASLASIFLCLNFILCAMAGVEILWHIFAGIALLGGAGRAFGLDYYIMPWLKKWWNRTRIAKRTYLYIGEPTIKA